MSEFETALITSILDNRDIRTAIRRKVTPAHFLDTQTRAAYQFLLTWYSNPLYGDTPSWESFAHNFPEFSVNRVEESLIALTDALRDQKLYNDIAGLVGEVGERVGGDPKEAFDFLREQVVKLNTAHVIDDTRRAVDSTDRIKAQYLQMESGETGGLRGKPFPWPALNKATLGIKDEDLIFLYGRPKSGKTWVWLYIAEWLRQSGYRVLQLSQEISIEQMEDRAVALACGVDWNQLRRGQLDPRARADFFDNMAAYQELDLVNTSRISAKGDAALIELASMIDEYNPDVVMIDGFYFLTTNEWKDVATLVSGTKDLCKAKKRPIIATTQANRTRGKKGNAQDDADDMAFGDSLFQYADLCLRLTGDIEDRKARQRRLFTAGVRDGEQTLFSINFKLANDLSQKAEHMIEDDDEAAAPELDGEEDTRD